MLSLILAALLSGSAFAKPLEVVATPIGITESERLAIESRALISLGIRNEATRPTKRFRVVASEIVENKDENPQYLLYVHDSDKNLMLQVSGPVDFSTEPVSEIVADDFPASPEEFTDALEILGTSPEFSESLNKKILLPYDPMPSTSSSVEILRGNGGPRRIHVGLNSPKHPDLHEIVAVDLRTREIIRFAERAPETALAERAVCGPPSAGQSVTGKGVSGSALIELKDGNEVIWKFTVVRPSASSGSKGSGLEIRNVYYKNQLVLTRAHTPILNVQYVNNRCGPYRDWAYSENYFTAYGTDKAPGIRVTTTPPITIIDNGRDRGNFRGVAIHSTGDRTTLTTEISAGWYRYASKFELYHDGTIKPYFQFGAVSNTCVCYGHNHHVYWRFDFDIGDKYNSVQISNGSSYRPQTAEVSQKKSSTVRSWRILNSAGTLAYDFIPGPSDGTADTYGVADAWLLRYRSGQIDDASVRTSTRAALNAFVTGESLTNADLVMWYSGHYGHFNSELELEGSTVGPTIRRVPLNFTNEE